jgi:hypothetical protein
VWGGTGRSERSVPTTAAYIHTYIHGTLFGKVRIPHLTKDRKFLGFRRGVTEDSRSSGILRYVTW